MAVGRLGGSAAGLLDVVAGDEAPFLAPHEVALLPDLEPRMRTRLDEYQLERIGEIQAIPDDALAAVFGSPGRLLGQHARGIDPRPVLPPAVKAEFRAAHTLGNDSNDIALLHRVLRHLTERLGGRLRARQLVARRLTIHLAYTDYATAKRSVPLALAALDIELWNTARQAFALANQRTVALRAIGVSVDRFLEADLQLELWGEVERSSRAQRGISPGTARSSRDPSVAPLPRDDGHRASSQAAALQTALDRIRTRWGSRGAKVGR